MGKMGNARTQIAKTGNKGYRVERLRSGPLVDWQEEAFPSMKTTTYVVLALAAAMTARADFSYTSTVMTSGMPGGAATGSTRHLLKGQKMKTDTGDNAMIMDFEAQTMTNISASKKTYSVMKFSDLGSTLKRGDIDAKVDLKETGQKKTINGFNASEVVMSLEMDTPAAAKAGMKMQMEVDMWLSSDVPGAKELKAFYQKNAGNFPWAALTGGEGSNMQKAMVEMQKKVANLGGVPVLQVVRMKSAGSGPQAAQMQQGMAQARERLEAMAAGSGPGAEQAKQALARMGGAASGSGSMFEITTESSAFSTNSIPGLGVRDTGRLYKDGKRTHRSRTGGRTTAAAAAPMMARAASFQYTSAYPAARSPLTRA